MKCPHCGALLFVDEAPLTKDILKNILRFNVVEYDDNTVFLIWRVLILQGNTQTSSAYKFLKRIRKFDNEQVQFALRKFFELEYHLKGYEWQWAAGMVARENTFKQSQLKHKLPPLPKEKL